MEIASVLRWFTVRRLMVVVAVLALVLTGGILLGRRQQYQGYAEACRFYAFLFSEHSRELKILADNHDEMSEARREQSRSLARNAAEMVRQEALYRHAADHPWISAPEPWWDH